MLAVAASTAPRYALMAASLCARAEPSDRARTLLPRSCRLGLCRAATHRERNGAGGGRRTDGEGKHTRRSQPPNCDPTAAEDPGRTVFHLPSTRSVFETPSSLGSPLARHRAARRRPRRRAAPSCVRTSAGMPGGCGWTSPKLSGSPPRGGAANHPAQRRAPPGMTMLAGRHAACLPRRVEAARCRVFEDSGCSSAIQSRRQSSCHLESRFEK